uniref:Uncharacterized protein n=1 Tax=Junco hyemalis TaxID=40217 RepID=A0A8C5JL12_JUNHY
MLQAVAAGCRIQHSAQPSTSLPKLPDGSASFPTAAEQCCLVSKNQLFQGTPTHAGTEEGQVQSVFPVYSFYSLCLSYSKQLLRQAKLNPRWRQKLLKSFFSHDFLQQPSEFLGLCLWQSESALPCCGLLIPASQEVPGSRQQQQESRDRWEGSSTVGL